MTDATELQRLLADHHDGVLVTIKRDGRPQLSNITYAFDGEVARISTRDGLAKVANLRRDPRASLHVTGSTFASYVVAEGDADLSPVAAAPDDATVEELIELYRAAVGEHPDWDDYRRAMVRDRRVVVRVRATRLYGRAAP